MNSQPVRRVAATGLALVLCALAGSSLASTRPTRVGVEIKALDNPFFIAMFEGVKERAPKIGAKVTIKAASSLSDTNGQGAGLAALVAHGYDCYLVNPISQTNLIRPLRGVSKPIVNIDNPIAPAAARAAGVRVTSYIGTDNVTAGRLAGREMLALLPHGGDIALIGGIAGHVTSAQRLGGFRDGVRGSRVRVVDQVAADWDRNKAWTVAARLLRSHPSLDGFFAANDEMALGIAEAVQLAGKTPSVRIIGVDGIKEALTAVRRGGISATVSQYPFAMGAMGVEACTAAAHGARLPVRVDSPIQLVTRANAARALAEFPAPFRPYADPFVRLLPG